MNPDNSLDPDQLLKAITKQEEMRHSGRLKIFFGMSAGVGKTFAMLQDAHQRLKEGVSLVVGTVNTHGRVETEQLLAGLPIIPEKWITYKDTLFTELDAERIIALKPDLVLIDELAHTNVPGSKHPKRWQDVIEILDAGIDVYSTLNVQHLESRKDLVEGITNVTIHETVSDVILERANSIELIDLPPPELLQRLKEGKVYLGEQSILAAENFFQEDNLTALREIALRFTAEKVDHDLHGILSLKKSWRTHEKVMVAVTSAPSSQQLIRAARRLAFELDAPWIAVHVDTGAQLNVEDQARLNRYLQLAQELGAEIVTAYEIDVPVALKRIAQQKDITRIIIGRPAKQNFLSSLFKKSFLQQLEEDNPHVDILIYRQDKAVSIYRKTIETPIITSSVYSFIIAVISVLVVSGFGFLLSNFLEYKSIGLIYLINILVLGQFVGFGPILLAAILSTLVWDFFFINHETLFSFSNPDDVLIALTYFIAAAALGFLSNQTLKRENFLTNREKRMERLYEIMREIATSSNFQTLRQNVCSKLKLFFGQDFDILIKNTANELIFDSIMPIFSDEKERAGALWSFQKGKLSGRGTDTLPSAQATYFPILYGAQGIGILFCYGPTHKSLSSEQINLLQIVTHQLGNYLERFVIEEKTRIQDFTFQVEKIQKAIFHSFSASFYYPLEKIDSGCRTLFKQITNPEEKKTAVEILQANQSVKFTIDNILAISHIESGIIRLNKKENSLKELVKACLDEIKLIINHHPIHQDLSKAPDLISFDFDLLKLALKNLLKNAMENSEESLPVIIQTHQADGEFHLSVIDQGRGIPPEIAPLIFEKFYASEYAQPSRMGLGLTVVKEAITLHEGRVEMRPLEKQGTVFILIIPV